MAAASPSLDPRVRVVYLLAVAIGVFVAPRVWVLAALGAQLGLWFVVGLPARRLARQVLKLWGFAAFIVLSYALVADDPRTDRWVPFELGPLHGSLNLGAAAIGLTMVLRVLTVVIASQVARAGDPRAVAAGLARLGAPRNVSVVLDTVLALMGDAERHGRGGGRGRGGGGGGGGRRGGGGGDRGDRGGRW